MPNPKIKLLIVDDDPSIVVLLSQIFTELGHSVRSAQDGLAAFVDIRQDMPDVILSDLNMPGMSGFEFLSVVRRRFPTIYVIAMSGAFLGDGLQAGIAADHFYEKATNLGFFAADHGSGDPTGAAGDFAKSHFNAYLDSQ